MPKRVKTEDSPAPKTISSPPSPEPSPRKRSRKSTKVEEEECVVDVDPEPEQSSSANSSDHENKEEDVSAGSGPITRDPDYYFADGSVIVRVDNVLFKVHASVLAAHSKIFKEMFDVQNGSSEATEGNEMKQEHGGDDEDEAADGRRGTSDDCPMMIGYAVPSQFRNLLKVIYCLPSSDFVNVLESNANGERAWGRFDLLADVAELSRQFGIPDLGKWATNQLEVLLRSHTESIARHFGQLPDNFDWLVAVLRDTKNAAPHLAYDIRYLIQYSCHRPDDPVALGNILCLFRTEGLRAADEALYGYAFLLLLNRGHNAWTSEDFSQMDRMALFSAQSYLTPLPKSLYEGMKSPLFDKPDTVVSFSNQVFPKVTEPSCFDGCQKVAFRAWKEEFNARYYDIVNGQNTLACIDTLASLPSRRLKFAHKVRAQTCHFGCLDKVVNLVDRDLELLYAKLAGYYKAIE